ncbi:MAG: PIN domain-containing protein [Burkholderiales bacterium]
MIGLDTNVIVRYLIQDDARQADKATKLIEKECSVEAPGWVDQIVLCELVWVLESAYGYSRALIANVLQQILSSAELRVESPDQVRSAVRAFIDGTADFADFLIGIRNRDQGCSATVTFDKKAARFVTHRLIG